jgi:hypothetical protein
MRRFSVICCAVLLSACDSTSQPTDTASAIATGNNSTSDKTIAADASPAKSAYEDEGKQVAWIDLGESAIKAKLRDPDSAQWRNVKFYSGGGVPIVCGEVNANNGFGGKGGYERFVAAGDKLDVLESEMQSTADMDGVWDRFCR